ncbi:MAG: GNAT family N-acetyltransferase [Acidobacteria bacterium]|nr:GNAT family N-acetyltransferase [Acidobacteriota bacterium]
MQRTVWAFEDQDLIPVRFFVVARKIEGQVLGAFDGSGKMVGFTLAVPALHGSLVYLHSHMAAVLSGFRGQGLGRRLKLEQRRKALERGIRLIEWTFDPLEIGNAYFNLNRLGAIVRRYVVNQYGISSSPLHRGLPTDRLVAEWWLDSPRATAAAAGKTPPEVPVAKKISVPASGMSMPEIQLKLRSECQAAFAEGLSAVGFENETRSYLIGRWSEAENSDRAM